jgi:DNA-binding protein YbaB
MQPEPFTIEALNQVRVRLREDLSNSEPPPIEVTEAGLVTLTMTAHSKVTALTLPADLAGTDSETLAQALITAFNRAEAEVRARRRLHYETALSEGRSTAVTPIT